MTNEMLLGITGTVTGVLGFIISLATALLSFRQHWLDRPKLKVTAHLSLCYRKQDSADYLSLTVHAINEGRRPILLKGGGYVDEGGSKRSGPFISQSLKANQLSKDSNRDIKLEENEYHDFIFSPFPFNKAINIGEKGTAFVEDTRNRYQFTEFKSRDVAEDLQKLLSIRGSKTTVS